MSSNPLDFHCHHCNSKVSMQEVADGWCETCGKKLPLSVRGTVMGKAPVSTPPTDAYDEPPVQSGRRLLWSIVVLSVLLLAVGAGGVFLAVGL